MSLKRETSSASTCRGGGQQPVQTLNTDSHPRELDTGLTRCLHSQGHRGPLPADRAAVTRASAVTAPGREGGPGTRCGVDGPGHSATRKPGAKDGHGHEVLGVAGSEAERCHQGLVGAVGSSGSRPQRWRLVAARPSVPRTRTLGNESGRTSPSVCETPTRRPPGPPPAPPRTHEDGRVPAVPGRRGQGRWQWEGHV